MNEYLSTNNILRILYSTRVLIPTKILNKFMYVRTKSYKHIMRGSDYMPTSYNDIINARIESVLLIQKIEKRFEGLLSENNSTVFDYIMGELELNAHDDVDNTFVSEEVVVTRFRDFISSSLTILDIFLTHFKIEGLTLESKEFQEFLKEFKKNGKYSDNIWTCCIEGTSYYFDRESLEKLLKAENLGVSLVQEYNNTVLSVVAEVPNREEIVRRKLEVK